MPILTQEEARQRVARGAALLDTSRPGWLNEDSNEAALNIRSANLLTATWKTWIKEARRKGTRQ